MKITVYNVKGGQGKTTISVGLALTLELNLLTNDLLSPVDSVLPADEVLKLSPDEPFPDLPEDMDIVFDMGGYLDFRVIDALKQSDKIIIPVINEFLDLQTAVDFISHVEKYNKEIIIVANRTEKGDYENIKEIMNEYYPYPVFELKKSRALPNIMREKQSVHSMVAEGGLKKYNYQIVAEQLDAIIGAVQK